jgi:hypothetical protein
MPWSWRGHHRVTYLAVVQLLPPRQRAVLILRDVLDWSAREAANLLDMTVAAALVREDIRVTCRRTPGASTGWPRSGRCWREGLTGRVASAADPRQPPADGRQLPQGAGRHRVLRVEGGRIAEITTFDATLFPAFGLPPTL